MISFGGKPNVSFANIHGVSDFNIGVNIGLGYDRGNTAHQATKQPAASQRQRHGSVG